MAGSRDDLKSLVKSLQYVQCSTCSSGDKVFDRMLVTRARNKKSSCIAIRGSGELVIDPRVDSDGSHSSGTCVNRDLMPVREIALTMTSQQQNEMKLLER